MSNNEKGLLILEPIGVSFIIQGPEVFFHGENVTKKLINEINSFFPGNDVIFSTWESHIGTYPNCRVINNMDPGIVDHNESKFLLNMERQRLSTIKGIQCAKSAYVFKIRSDALIKGDKFDVKTILKILRSYSQSRICLFYHTCPTKLGMIDDRVQFGRIDLMLQFWSFDYKKTLEKATKLAEKKVFSRYFMLNIYDNMNFSPEQLMFFSHCGFSIEKRSIYGMYLDYCLSLQKNFLLMDSCRWGICSTKWKMSSTLSSRLYIYASNKRGLARFNALLFVALESTKVVKALIWNR